MKCDELKWNWVYCQYLDAPDKQKESALKAGYTKVVRKSEVDKVIAEKDEEIARLKDKCLDVKDATHVLKAFKFYLCQLTHCAYYERTAQWIIDNWEQDYDRVEEYKG